MLRQISVFVDQLMWWDASFVLVQVRSSRAQIWPACCSAVFCFTILKRGSQLSFALSCYSILTCRSFSTAPACCIFIRPSDIVGRDASSLKDRDRMPQVLSPITLTLANRPAFGVKEHHISFLYDVLLAPFVFQKKTTSVRFLCWTTSELRIMKGTYLY